MPSPAADVASWRADGWTPLDPLHELLCDHERARHDLGDAAVEGPSGPVLDWPEGWDAQSLAEHRRIVAAHFKLSWAIRDAERAAASGGLSGLFR